MKDRRVIDWLLEENEPSVRYHTLIDLLGRGRSDPEVREAYSDLSKKGWAFGILNLQKPEDPHTRTSSNVINRKSERIE
jgi:hypothetical protein